MQQIARPVTTSAIARAVTSMFSSTESSETFANLTLGEVNDAVSSMGFSMTAGLASILKPFTSAQPTSNHYMDVDSAERISDDENSPFLVHTVCCCILIAFEAIQYIVLGALRASEQQHLRETFWDYSVQKSLFVFFILDAKSHQERSAWAIWFTVLGSIILLSRLCRDRFEYLTSLPATKRWPLIKIAILMTFLLFTAILCNAIIPVTELSHTLFLLADASYVLTFVISVISRIALLTHDMRPSSILENSAAIGYYSDLFFSMAMLSIELFHHSHLLLVSHASMMIRGICLVKIHTLFMEIRRRYRRHKHYLLVIQLMESNFANATKEEIEQFSDECAICWDSMESARKLPCGHLFHNSCLRSWLEQDTSCPTCRTTFKGQHRQRHDDLNQIDDTLSENEEEIIEATRPHQRNHLFHFDSSRYTNYPFLSWLPTISIEGFI